MSEKSIMEVMIQPSGGYSVNTMKVAVKLIVFAIAIILPGLVLAVELSSAQETREPRVVAGQVLVHLAEDIRPVLARDNSLHFGEQSLDQISRQRAFQSSRKVFPWRMDDPAEKSSVRQLSRYYVIYFPDTIEVEKVVAELQGELSVILAEPVWLMPVSDLTPNDPSVSSQWHVNKIGLPQAWESETGSDSTKLAMIDTGVNYRHPDLKNNIWINPGEDIDGDQAIMDADDLNGIDDDGNGVVDDLIGYDFLIDIGLPVPSGEDPGVADPDPIDFHGHGTHCAGIAAAMTNNLVGGTGISGGWSGGPAAMARGSRIMCLRTGASDSDGGGWVNSVDCATAIDYAVLMGADVINCSWGSSSVQHFAVLNAHHSGVLVVHAAGNDNSQYPGYLDDQLGSVVISVASTTSTDRKATSSNYGDWIDISAPGNSIFSTVSKQLIPSYAIWSGTSMAAPMVAGLSLLLRSAMPSLEMDSVAALILATADNIDATNPDYIGQLGSGRINAASAISHVARAKFSVDCWEGEAPLAVNFVDQSPNSPTSWDWSFGNGEFSSEQNPSQIYDLPGQYSVSLIVQEPNGQGEEHLTDLIWVQADTISFDSVSGGWYEEVIVPVHLNHTTPIYGLDFAFTYQNDAGVNYVRTSLEGLDSEQLFTVSNIGYSPSLNARGIRLSPLYEGASLAPGGSVLLNLIFEIEYGATPDAEVVIDTISWAGYTSSIITPFGSYWPESYPGKVIVIYEGCCGLYSGGATGNTDCDTEGKITLTDITRLIDRVYVSKTVLCCEENGNTDGDTNGAINLSDITRLIDVVYITKAPAEPCQ